MPFLSPIKQAIMSVKDKIKRFLSNIWDLFRQWYEVAEDFIKDHIHVAVVVTENVKKFVENPVGDFLLTVIDDKIPIDLKDKLKDILPKILLGLHLIDDCKDLNQEDMFKCIASHFQDMEPDIKNAMYRSLSTLIAERLSDGKIDAGDAAALIEWYYKNKVKVTDKQ